MTAVNRILKHLQGSVARDVTSLRTGRMSVSGKNILDENGNPWVCRGVNIGQTELYLEGDMALIAALGFNCVRIVCRKWGTYGDSNYDSDSNGATVSSIQTAYFDRLVRRVIEAKAAGLKVDLAFDSNCGQFERTGDAVCELGTGSPQTLWTAGGATKRTQHRAQIRYYARTLLGLVDFYEPIVEPSPATTIPTGVLKTDIQTFQNEVRTDVLAEDPAALFIIGGTSYYNNALANWYRADWVGNTVWTCNELSNAMANTDPNWAADVANIVSFRSTAGVPVLIQQAGTTVGDDPTNSILTSRLNDLNTASGGSIGWIYWEMVSKGAGGGYGWYTANVPNINDRTLNSGRRTALQTAANAAKVAAS